MASQSKSIVVPDPLVVNRFTSRLRVVIADDSTAFVHVLSACLEMDHFMEIVGVATDGAEAVQQADDLAPDVLLMDVHMPYLNGFEATLIASRQQSKLVIILMSAEDSPRLRAEARSCGAHGFIPKSNLLSELVATVEQARDRLAGLL
jgi:two-component system NarL family response regulator